MLRRCWLNAGLQIGLVGSVGAIAPWFSNHALAQSVIVPDNTLGVERSQVIQNFLGLPLEVIIGGATRGTNLFHSFQEFNVSQGRGAYFAVPSATVQNILARVTGTNPSQILGVLGTFQFVGGNYIPSNANLFLINPNGIIFGPGASLDVGGSFVATTANAIKLGNTGFFSASTSEPTNLLTVSPSAFFFNALNPQAGIVNQSRVQGTSSIGGLPVTGLQVPSGKSLLLVGGNVSFANGTVQALGGQVEVGGLSVPGTIGLTLSGSKLGLSFPDGVERGDVSLNQGSFVNVAAGGGGSITINAHNLNLIGGSVLQAGIAPGFGPATSRAGDITLNATAAIQMDGGGVGNIVQPGGLGNAGNIVVNASSLTVTNGAQLDSSTFGQGDAGNVLLTVRDAATFDGVGRNAAPSGAASQVELNASGKGGNVVLSAGSLKVTNGALLNSNTFGQGDAGNVVLTVRDAATFDGVGSNGTASNARSQVAPTAVGKGGNVVLSAGSLTVANGAALSSRTFGQGDAGNVTLTIRGVATFDGIGSNGTPSIAGSQVASTAVGKGGDVTLSAASLTVSNGAQLGSSTAGQGDTGNVVLTVRDAATFNGVGSNGLSSIVGSQVASAAVGKGGDVTLSAGSLTVTNGAVLSSSTAGQGDAGNVVITVRDAATFDGVGSNGVFSKAESRVAPTAIGNGGNLTLSAGSLTLSNGAQLNSSTLGQGQAGSIVLRVSDQLQLSSSTIATASLLTAGGSIDITAQTIRLSGSSNILTSVLSGTGNAGTITLTANSIIALNDSNILAFARDGIGGNVTLNTRAFFGQNYHPALPGTDPSTLIGNGRVDINASGAVSGIISLPDVSFLQNSLNEFPQTFTDTTQLLANSCIVRRGKQTPGSFTITGSGGLPQRPGDAPLSPFPTGEVRSLPTQSGQTETSPATSKARSWKIGDPIVEPQGVYKLANGELVMSRECSDP